MRLTELAGWVSVKEDFDKVRLIENSLDTCLVLPGSTCRAYNLTPRPA